MLRKIFRSIIKLYLWAAERLYHEFAWMYDFIAWMVSLGQWHRIRMLVLPYIRGNRVLEIGSGTGVLLQTMKNRGINVYGVDASRQMIRVAKNRLQRSKVFVPILRGKTQKLPFAAGSFDTIISTFPAPYILDPETIRECARVLVSDSSVPGRMIIAGSTIRSNNVFNRYWKPKVTKNPIFRDFSKIAEKNGFQVIIKEKKISFWITQVIILIK